MHQIRLSRYIMKACAIERRGVDEGLEDFKMAVFSGGLRLTDLDDFITPSQVRSILIVCGNHQLYLT